MKRYLTALALALVLVTAVPSLAQFPDLSSPSRQTARLYATREKLIHQYAPTYVWGVSACGTEDAVTGEEYSWLCVYAYKDTLHDFSKALVADNAKLTQGVIFVDGVALEVKIIERQKSK